jgi:molybdopterin-biosynthesis enzyme MoeA-like protein
MIKGDGVRERHFYAVIIGTEILNGRRTDKHFDFLADALNDRGFSLFASFIIKDDALLIEETYRMIKRDENAVMFSFGGIGSTPDDLTRAIAARVFTEKPLHRHGAFERDIIDRFGDDAFPHRIHMADLPEGSELLKNPVNNMSGFYLAERYFFVPGFPEMAHPMIDEALGRFYPRNKQEFRKTLLAQTSENTLIDIMQSVPKTVELSSLPMFKNGRALVELSVASYDEALTGQWFDAFASFLRNRKIAYKVLA